MGLPSRRLAIHKRCRRGQVQCVAGRGPGRLIPSYWNGPLRHGALPLWRGRSQRFWLDKVGLTLSTWHGLWNWCPGEVLNSFPVPSERWQAGVDTLALACWLYVGSFHWWTTGLFSCAFGLGNRSWLWFACMCWMTVQITHPSRNIWVGCSRVPHLGDFSTHTGTLLALNSSGVLLLVCTGSPRGMQLGWWPNQKLWCGRSSMRPWKKTSRLPWSNCGKLSGNSWGENGDTIPTQCIVRFGHCWLELRIYSGGGRNAFRTPVIPLMRFL